MALGEPSCKLCLYGCGFSFCSTAGRCTGCPESGPLLVRFAQVMVMASMPESWLRTIRPGIPPSELVVAEALRQTLPDFLLTPSKSNSLSKFIAERQDAQNMRIFGLAS